MFSTDKTGQFTVDTAINYEEALNEHIEKDTVINEKKVRDLEKKCNDHLKQLNKMFSVGATFGHQGRVANASTATNVPAPPLRGLRKDHKAVQPGMEVRGPSVRPVVGRLGHFLSRIINNYADCIEDRTECRSSEEMRSAFGGFNKLSKERRLKCQILSMDVKALYPSMSWNEIVKSVKWMILNSIMQIDNVDWFEVGKYLAVVMSAEEISEEGLDLVIPKRRGLRLRRITVNYLRQKKNSDKWLPARRPGVRQKQKMLALAVGYGVYTTMSSHTYKVGDKLFLQSSGGPIGLELTGAVARPFMLRWDKMYLANLKKAGMEMELYERYVDDSDQVAVVPPPGAKYDEESRKLVIDQNAACDDENDDERTARVLTDIANHVMPGIVMEFDVPSKNSDGKMPILDMKVWMEKDNGNIMFQHFEKPMASQKIMHAKSAQSISCKNSVHTQEIIRRLLNSCPQLDWKNDIAPVISNYMARMMDAGYPVKYRKDTLDRALRIYDRMVEEDRNGVRPLYRPKEWNVVARTRDCLSRQVREAVLIRRCQVPVLNSKTEWHQPALFRIQNEILRG